MNVHSVLFAALLALGCPLSGCEPSHVALQPEAEHVAVNDNRSIESCTAVGLVTATDPDGIVTTPPQYTLNKILRNRAADRGANYVEAMPMECGRGIPCSQAGNAYRCPDPSASANAKSI